MAQIAVLERKCTGCGLCSESCPFGAIDMKDGKPELNAACRVCGICVKTCPEKAMIRLETRVASVDKSQWKDILVFAEVADGRLHPVSLELIGKAQELAQGVPGFQVKAVLLGNGVMELARELQHYGVSEVVAYDDPALSFFRADVFATCIEDYIRAARPSVVLVGATSLGRSLAPRLSTRFHTGLTADCTRLELRENTDLVQIRPAFGGNLMATIICPNHRPQMATVRPGIFKAPDFDYGRSGTITQISLADDAKARVEISIPAEEWGQQPSIANAERLVVVGRGIGSKKNLPLMRRLAEALGAELGCTRPVVEAGWLEYRHQIGQTGVSVSPRLLVSIGVSGAIQHLAGIGGAECIIAINEDPDAPIFGAAQYKVVGEAVEVVEELLAQLER